METAATHGTRAGKRKISSRAPTGRLSEKALFDRALTKKGLGKVAAAGELQLESRVAQDAACASQGLESLRVGRKLDQCRARGLARRRCQAHDDIIQGQGDAREEIDEIRGPRLPGEPETMNASRRHFPKRYGRFVLLCQDFWVEEGVSILCHSFDDAGLNEALIHGGEVRSIGQLK